MEGVSKEKALKTFKSNLEAALPLLEAAKVVGLIEPINPYSMPLSEILPFYCFVGGLSLSINRVLQTVMRKVVSKTLFQEFEM